MRSVEGISGLQAGEEVKLLCSDGFAVAVTGSNAFGLSLAGGTAVAGGSLAAAAHRPALAFVGPGGLAFIGRQR